jgi:hypothetical protein
MQLERALVCLLLTVQQLSRSWWTDGTPMNISAGFCMFYELNYGV